MRKKSRRRYAEEWIRGGGGGEEGELDENKLDKQGKEEKELCGVVVTKVEKGGWNEG